MKLLDRYNSIALATVELAILCFSLSDGNIALAILSSIVVGAAWLLRRHDPPPALPKWFINTLSVAAIAYALARSASSAHGHAVVSDLGEFLVYVQLIKIFDRRSHRDETQLLTLSVFLVVAAILTSNALVLGALLTLYTPMIIGSAMLLQARQGHWMRARRTGDARAPAQPPGAVRSRADRQLVGLTLRSTLLICIIAAIVFVLTPRGIGENGLGSFGQARQMSVGFTDTIKLGQSGLVSQSPRPVLDLRVTDPDGRNVGSVGRMFYLRATTRDRYDPTGRLWLSTGQGPATASIVSGTDDGNTTAPDLKVARTAMTGIRFVQRITLRTPNRDKGYFFTSWRPISLTLEPDKDSITPDPRDRTYTYRSPPGGPLTYSVLSAPTMSDPDDAPRNTQFPENPDVRAIAEELLRARRIDPESDLSDPSVVRQVCATLRDHFQSGFEYTLDLPAPPRDKDPIVWFLTTSKRGHCEYYASALTLMLQSLHIPARLVTGYLAADFNTLTGEYLVRESDAHAWVEVYLGEGRWQLYEPTPSGAIEDMHRPATTLLSRFRQWYDRIEVNWSSSIVGFDKLKQSQILGGRLSGESLLANLSLRLEAAGDWVLQRFGLSKAKLGGAGLELPPALIPLLPFVVAGAAGVYLLWRRTMRRLGVTRTRKQKSDQDLARLWESLAFYRRALSALQRVGQDKPHNRSPIEHADALEPHAPELAEALRIVARLYYRVRFGRHQLSTVELAEAEAAADRVQTAAEALNPRAATGR